MSELGLFRYINEESIDYFLALPNARSHGATHTDTRHGIIHLRGLGVISEHWRKQIGFHALRSICAGIMQIEPHASTLLAELDSGLMLSAIKDTFEKGTIQVFHSPEVLELAYDELLHTDGLDAVRRGTDYTSEFMLLPRISGRPFGEGNTFAIVDLSTVETSGWEVPRLITK